MAGTCAIIVCDHGLGHVRRCALMAKEREKTGELVTLFAPLASVERLQRAVPSIAGLTVSDFSTQMTAARVRKGLPVVIDWLDRLPNLDGWDTVICDNLPEILARRPDAIISAQFFWYDAIDGAATDYAEYCEGLLAQHKPTVIGCDLFAMDAVRRQPGFIPVGLYKIPELVAAAQAGTAEGRNDLLVTGGTTPAAYEQLKEVICELLRKGPHPYERVHVDAELLPANPPTWMAAADFSLEMYCQLRAAVCRPGLGVLTDLLTLGVEISPLFEVNNREMLNNAKIIAQKFPAIKTEGGIIKW